ncbi:MAG TPA: M23 family metallopeptidase [Euzebyales bacterium]|nr:M23 family metallopeptidase [Euzebyales bacterium]
MTSGGERGSVALLAVVGGGLALLLTLAPLTVVADLLVTRGRAQTAADAAALAAMGDAGGDGRDAAGVLARANGGAVLACCGDDPARRHVTVGVPPDSTLLSAVVPEVEAEAAAALMGGGVADGPPSGPMGPGGRMWPVAAPVTSGFGARVHPLTGTSRLHAGIDLGAPAGTPIRAAAAGTVVAAGVMGGYGNAVDIRHAAGTTTRYAHQSRLLVRAGQQVAAGQVIGLVGSTGASTGPHLHFEVRTPAGPIDPRTWLPG